MVFDREYVESGSQRLKASSEMTMASAETVERGTATG